LVSNFVADGLLAFQLLWSGIMNLDYFIERFSNNRAVFISLLAEVSLDQSRWRPSPDKWSMLEVVNHLYDEEREDFRQRLQLTLANPAEPWPSINPREWVVTRRYNDREIDTALNNFLMERETSLRWLRELSEPNWENYNQGPNGRLSAGDLLASWLAHDFLHIRQLARLHWQYVGETAQPYQTTYGGPWKETEPAGDF
jgi:uncharacterized damage-inducible protein DinB